MATESEISIKASGYEIQIAKLEADVTKIDQKTVTLQELTLDLEKVKKFEEAIDVIRISWYGFASDDAHLQHIETALSGLEDALKRTKIIILKMRDPISTPTVAPPNPVRPPPLPIPTFSGRFEDWPTFHDKFQAQIDSRTDIQGSIKIAYLQNALEGEPAALVAAYEQTNANYQEAWNQLKARYQIKREIVFSLVSTFLDFKPSYSDAATGLRSIANAIQKCRLAFKTQGIALDASDPFVVVTGIRKLDPESRQQWSMHFKGDLPTIDEFAQFLELRALSLTPTCSSSQPQSNKSKVEKTKSSHHVSKAKQTLSSPGKSCLKCSGDHFLTKCPDFKKFNLDEKWNYVKQKRLCFWCLSTDHNVESCHYKKPCKCGEKHHYLLHKDSPSQNQTSPTSSANCAFCPPGEQVVLLGTLLVKVKDAKGLAQQCRVFVDNGSESHFISQHCLDRLGLKPQKVNVPLNAIGHEPGPVSKGQVALKIESTTESFTLSINALVLPKFAGLIPATKCQATWSHLEKLKLSDPQFHKPHYTDILLGAAKSGHILLPGVVTHPTNPRAPVAINTRFGWMLNGEAPAVRATRAPRSIHHVTIGSDKQNLDDLLVRFWEQEEPEPTQKPQSSSDVECEQHFTDTHTENSDGTYTVHLPFRPEALQLGRSREAAVRRFQKVEERLEKQPAIKAEYVKSINEFISLGYLEPIPPEEFRKPPSASYYMPHREVVKESSSSTKVRVVFDASAKTSTGVSLNSTLHTGPKLQVDLVPLLLRFMSFPIVMSADIWKFYPQTSVHENHRDFQRLVWREEREQPLRDLRMTRVTFGVSAAPYLAIRAFHELANKVQNSHPLASEAIKKDFLVDNLLSGANSLQDALQLKDELLEVMKIGGLKLLKFMSNSEELLESVPLAQRDPATFHPIDEGDFVKTIGILWNPTLDTFSIKIQVPPAPAISTKRNVLSTIARTFDPLGWGAPVTVTPKILIQKLWKEGLSWDEPLPLHLDQEWRSYCEALPLLQGFSLPRNAFAAPHPESTDITHQLHGFSDGSDHAHAACVYIRTEDSCGRAAVSLLTAKTKVNPILKPTTPRSELCGALLLSNLVSTVLKAVKVDFTSIHCWTDSTVVLGRLSPEKKLPVFELNRIRKILAVLPPHHWNHVKGEDNPADAPSRGIHPRQLLDHPLWLHGPEWLKEFKPATPTISVSVATVQPTPVTDFLMRCSSLGKMKGTMAYILRFVQNVRKPKPKRRTGGLRPMELQCGLTAIVKIIQKEAFPEEIRKCSQGTLLKDRLKVLAPFLDREGVLRVGGRLMHADIPESQKHPALLPKNHHVVDVIARHYHMQNLHAGPNLLLAILRQQFWPVNGLYLTKRVVRRCVTCHRHQAVPATQLMGQLPASRVNPSPPFSQVGVDYAGPFQMALRTGRKPPIVKAYVAVFVCMATKATHLELVSDLTTAAFIAALQRFISRRGLPCDVYSDEGTNFVGAKSELDELLKFVNSAAHIDGVKDFLSPQGITFHTNPPASPHHGGLWEAAVKSMKFHLRRVMGTRNLSMEEFRTLLCQVEAMLNSRPLTPLTDDPNDLSALTPGHFLIGRPLNALPYPDLGHVPISQLDRWQAVQCVSQHIWESWRKAYLSLLQSRPKWHAPLPDLATGTLVLIMDKDSSLGPQQWKLGRIVDVFPGSDGKTRVCDVRTNITAKNPKGTILKRPVVKLSPLPIY